MQTGSSALRARTRLFVGRQLRALSLAPLDLLRVTRSHSTACFEGSVDSLRSAERAGATRTHARPPFRLTSSSSTRSIFAIRCARLTFALWHIADNNVCTGARLDIGATVEAVSRAFPLFPAHANDWSVGMCERAR